VINRVLDPPADQDRLSAAAVLGNFACLPMPRSADQHKRPRVWTRSRVSCGTPASTGRPRALKFERSALLQVEVANTGSLRPGTRSCHRGAAKGGRTPPARAVGLAASAAEDELGKPELVVAGGLSAADERVKRCRRRATGRYLPLPARSRVGGAGDWRRADLSRPVVRSRESCSTSEEGRFPKRGTCHVGGTVESAGHLACGP
jgi:hypothetical protein